MCEKAENFSGNQTEHQYEKTALQAASVGGLHAFGDGSFLVAVSHEQELDARRIDAHVRDGKARIHGLDDGGGFQVVGCLFGGQGSH